MRFQGTALLMGILLWSGFPGRAQEVSHTATPTVIRTETRLVLVDAVVTDKKGNYLPDLAQKDFKVLEDNKEQTITSFSYEADPASPNNNQKRYLVLFFDNASVSFGEQMQARAAATKFVDANTGPNKFIAVVNFSGTLKVAQNFTNDADRLKAVISGVKLSTVSTSDPGGSGASVGGHATLSEAASFGVSSVLLGLRSLAKGLSDVPGRKMLVMLTAGFPLNTETRAELTATIDACNKSNVSVYPVDVRGLVSGAPGMMPGNVPGMGGRGGRENPPPPQARLGSPVGPAFGLRLASFSNSFVSPEQARGGAGGGSTGTGGGTTGAGSTGAGAGTSTGGARGGTSAPSGSTGSTGTTGSTAGRGGTTGVSAPGSVSRGGTTTGTNAGRGGMTPTNPAMNNNRYNNANSIVPNLPPNPNANLDALYMLADGTGGFVIINTNDLLGGMEKIAREQNQYYIIGFSPAESAEGSCHTLHVKVDKGGSNVRSRSGYCNVRQVDVLAGKPAETELEAIAVGQSKGKLGASLQLPYFYASPNVARVNVAMEIPSESFKFEKVKGKLHSEMNLLGIAYRQDGSVGAKFSDTVKLDYDNKNEVEAFAKKPLHYESQFDIATGEYNFKVVFSAGGENFGKIEKPLAIEPFDGKQFAVSSLALSKELRPTDNNSSIDAVLIEERVPLVSRGIQAIPAAVYSFKQTDSLGIYLEIYEPGLTEEKPPDVDFSLRVVDRKTNEQKAGAASVSLAKYIRPGNPLIPVILNVPVKDLPAGSYRLDLMGHDSVGKSQVRSADFEVESATVTPVGWDKI
jgi:VWFA-related protein